MIIDQYRPTQGGYAATVIADGATVYMRLGEATLGTPPFNSGSLGTSGVWGSGITAAQTSLLGSDPNPCAHFNGAGNVTIGNNTFANYSNNFTLEAVIRPTSVTGPKGIISHYTGGFYLRVNDGKLGFLRSFTTGIGETGAGTIAVNTTYHVAVTFLNGNWVMYINGSSAASGSGAVMGTGASNIVVGGDVGSENFIGQLDEVAVYPTALTAGQIANHNALR